MRLLPRLSLICFCLTLAAARSWAVEPAGDFLKALQKNGYGEAGIDYLEMLKAQGKLPPELQEQWDFEMSKCLALAVKESFSKAEAADREALSKQLLEKFRKEHPDSAVIRDANDTSANAAFQTAMQLLSEGKLNKDKAAAEKLMEDARKALKESRPDFLKSVEQYKEVYDKLKTPPQKAQTAKQKKDREDAFEDATLDYLDARMKVAMVDYYVAQTYPDAKTAGGKEALTTCKKALDAIYQENRGTLVGLYAHLWTGKCEDELGNTDIALDFYDEVLANEPDTTGAKDKETGLEPLMAQAINFRLQVKLRKDGIGPYMEEAEDWIKQWEGIPDSPLKKAYRNTDGYQAIALQVVKRNIELSEKATGTEKAKLVDGVKKRLREMVKVKSESQPEIFKLNNLFKGTASGGGSSGSSDPSEIKSFDEAATLADDAIKNGNFDEAKRLYVRAIELINDKVKDRQRISEMHTGLDKAGYYLSIKLYQAGKMQEAYDEATPIVVKKGGEPTSFAPKAGALCVQILLAQYAAAKEEDEKTALLNRMTKVAEYVLKKWPDQPEADDVRISEGRAELVRQNFKEALEIFEAVNPRSERKPLADQLAGQLHWRNYVLDKMKPEGERDPRAAGQERAKAEEQLTTSLDLQKKVVAKGEEWPAPLIETELLLAEIHLDKGEFQPSADLLQSLLDEYKVHKPQSIDKTVLRSFILAVRAYNGAGDFAKSGAAAEALIDIGETDSPEVNSISVNFVRLLGEEYKLVNLALIEAKATGGLPAQQAAQTKLDGLKVNLTKLLEKLGTKQNHSLAGLIFMGDTAASTTNTELAETLYKRALDQAEKEKANPQAGGAGDSAIKAVPRIRAQVVGLMLQKKQFAEGVKEIDKLIEEQPKALEPKMVKGRLLQAWAEEDKKDPQHFKDAENHWIDLRNKLERLPKKPLEYFEANYNVALCLWMEFDEKADKTDKDKLKATTARQLLHTMISKSPKLSGPEMVVRYNLLLDKITKALGPAGGNGKALGAQAAAANAPPANGKQ